VYTDRLASVRAAFILVKVSFLEKLVYRFNLVVGLFGTFVAILVFRQVWIALYGEREVYAGVTIVQMITYIAMSRIVDGIYPNQLIRIIERQLRSGDITFDITRPMYYGNLLLFQTMGQALSTIATTSLPMFVLVCLFLDIRLPQSSTVWLAFFTSLALGFFIAFLMDFVVSMLGFWTTGMNGLFHARRSIVSVLGGTYIPLWIFPPALGRILFYLPFSGIIYTPISILVGKTSLDQVPMGLGIQIVWIVLLVCISKGFYAAATKKLAVQGG
jgi:ABC-2 type transport system permease protein